MKKKTLIIATRKSPLALWQADAVKQALIAIHPQLSINLLGIRTQADKFLNRPLYDIGGKGLFVKELETALMKGAADIAVHSIKDLPAELPESLILAVICQREDPRDVLVSENYFSLAELPEGAKVGTSSLRRQCQLKAIRPDLQVLNLRGNVGSRLQKMVAGEFDAIILAAAGLKRLGEVARIRQYFSVEEFIPAIGQGAIGIECRRDDHETRDIIAPLDHLPTRYCITAERAMNEQFGGNCKLPIAAHAMMLEDQQMQAIGMVGQLQGNRLLRSHKTGQCAQAEHLGKELASALIEQGALALLKNLPQ